MSILSRGIVSLAGFGRAEGDWDDGLHARKRHQRVALGPGDVRLEPVDRRRGVACAAGFEYFTVIAPREGDMQKGALVGVCAKELVAAVGVGDDVFSEGVP